MTTNHHPSLFLVAAMFWAALFLSGSSSISQGRATAFVAPPPPSQHQYGATTTRSSSFLRSSPEIPTPEEDYPPAAAEGDEKYEGPADYEILSEEVSPRQLQRTTDGVLAANQAAQSTFPTINGWLPKEDYALWGLPGAIPPLGYFDPLGFCRYGLSLNDAKRMREAEVQHGRVAMVATVGYFAGETVSSVGGGPFHITGPANDQLQQMPAPAFYLLAAAVASAELYRAKRGWVEPTFRIGSNTLWTLRDSYYPGDVGFDPLNLKPTENYAFQRMQTKELSNGRLAMLGWAGMCAQELVNHRTIGETFEFYKTVFSGGDLSKYYSQ